MTYYLYRTPADTSACIPIVGLLMFNHEHIVLLFIIPMSISYILYMYIVVHSHTIPQFGC